MFSSSKETVVGTAALHTMDVDNLGNPIGDAVIEAVLTSGVPVASMQDITGRLIQSNLNGFSIKIDRAYDYARDHYALGLPTGASLLLPNVYREDIVPYILNETGYPYSIFITDHEYAVYTPMISIAAFLKNTREYNSITDTVNVWPPGTVFTQEWDEDISSFPKRVGIFSVEVLPDNITARVTYQKYIQRPVVVYGWIEEDGGDGGSYNRYGSYIKLKWVLDGTVTEDVSIPGATATTTWNGDCLFVLYKKLDSEDNILPTYYSWVYHLDDYLYPELHPDTTQNNATFLPVIPIRYNNVDLTHEDQNDPLDPTDLYSTSTKLMTLLGNNFESMGQRLNENPSIADIDHAYILFGVNLQSEHVPSLFYLTHHFYQLFLSEPGNETSFLAALDDPGLNDEPHNTFVYNPTGRFARAAPEDAFKEYGLALDIQYDYIKSWFEETTIGTGEVGHAEKSIDSYTVSYTVTNYDPDNHSGVVTTTETRYKLVLKAQINNSQVKVVEVYNLKLINWVYRRHHVITTLRDVRNNSDENGLIIPIYYELSKQVFDAQHILTRNEFYSNSMMMVINAIERIKVKWYQQRWFTFVIVVVAFIVTIWGGGWGAGLAAAAAQGMSALLIFMGTSILVGLAISYAVQWVVRHYGDKIGIIGAMIMTIAAIVASRGFGAWGTASSFMMTTSQALLQVSTALISATNEFLIEEGQEIRNDFEIFTEKMEGLWKELEEIQDLLAWKADLDPLTFTKPERLQILPNENPTVFFNRCLGLVDNTMFTIHDEIPNFMDMRLRHTKDITPDMYRLNSYN